jgi:hypothetical protein
MAYPSASAAGMDLKRIVFSSVVAGVLTVAAFWLIAASVTLASAWMIFASARGKLGILPNAPTALEMIALPQPKGTLMAVASSFVPTLAPDDPGDDPTEPASAPPALEKPAPEPATSAPPPLAAPARKRVRTAEAPIPSISPPDPDSRTAIYDIAAHAVYLPNGERLEAHSGLGRELDDPRYVNVKDRGPTPPNVYDLSLREQIFHGVRAIRLTPAGNGNMFGRDGILAHSYMLGPNGQSNGCVSFANYPAFLHAFRSGEVERLVVVAHLANEPGRSARSGRGNGDRYAFNKQ